MDLLVTLFLKEDKCFKGKIFKGNYETSWDKVKISYQQKFPGSTIYQSVGNFPNVVNKNSLRTYKN